MFEWLEKLMASLIVLVMLFILLLLAFPDRLSEMFSSVRQDTVVRQEQQDLDLTGPTALPKGDAKPQKTVGRLPDSSDNQKALYRYRYRDTAQRGEARIKRKVYVETRRVVHRPLVERHPEYYYSRRERYEPRYSYSRGDCSFGSCLCNCSKPYWASSDWNEDAGCWYE